MISSKKISNKLLHSVFIINCIFVLIIVFYGLQRSSQTTQAFAQTSKESVPTIQKLTTLNLDNDSFNKSLEIELQDKDVKHTDIKLYAFEVKAKPQNPQTQPTTDNKLTQTKDSHSQTHTAKDIEQKPQNHVNSQQIVLPNTKTKQKENLQTQPKTKITNTGQDIQDRLQAMIQTQCLTLGCDAKKIQALMMCESNGNPKAYNADGPYIGLFQYYPATFESYAKKYKITNPDIYNPDHQIIITTNVFMSDKVSNIWPHCMSKLDS